MSGEPEFWLRGPLNGTPALLQPIAHALLQAREEINDLMSGFPEALLWDKPAGLASPAFHLQHLSGVLDRLFTYARGEQLVEQQLDALKAEGSRDELVNAEILLAAFDRQVNAALAQLKETDESALIDERGVGRAQLPSTIIGLYIHAAEHTMRHVGQLLVTVKVLKEKTA